MKTIKYVLAGALIIKILDMFLFLGMGKIRGILKSIYFKLIGIFFTDQKFEKYQKGFLSLPDCVDIDAWREYRHGNLIKLDRPIQYYYDQLFDLITAKIASKEPYVIVRASDGEAYFLQGKLLGNGPTRHFTKSDSLTGVDLAPFKDGLLRCDSRHAEMYKRNRRRFVRIYGRNVFSPIPFECIYALLASRRILKNNYKIGIIGSQEKVKIIQKLTSFPAFQDYIGRSGFQDYIGIPERGSANDPIHLTEMIKSQLKSDIDIYLVGIGVAKLAVMHHLKENSKAVFLDAGAGISALAGLVGKERQYFAGWKNFRLKDYDYSQVDTMDADMKSEENIIFL